MVSPPASLGEMMQKALKMGVGEMSRQTCAGFPFLRASTNTAVTGWPQPQVSSQRHVPHDFSVAGLSTNPQCSVFQQYPALQLLLDPVQWPPIGQRAHMWTAVQKTLTDTTLAGRVDQMETSAEQESLGLSMSKHENILAHVGFEKEDRFFAEGFTNVEAPSSSQRPVEIDEAADGSSVVEKKRARRSRKQSAQSSQITELRERLRAQKLLSVKAELQHEQRSALRAWAAECKRARDAIAHQRELDGVAFQMAADQRNFEERLESASAKLALKISRLERQVRCSKTELQERRLLALSPSGRRWRLQRVALRLWVAGCAESKRLGVGQQPRNSTRRRGSKTSPPGLPPPLPSIMEVSESAENSSDGDRQSSPRDTEAGAAVSKGCGNCGCDQTWGCMHRQTYSKGVLLLHREMAQLIAQGPPGLSPRVGAEPVDRYQFKAAPRH